MRASCIAVHLALAAALALLAAPACSRSETSVRPAPTAAPRATYATRGTVRQIGDKKDTITIAHEDIPSYMKAMTMMFEVANPDLIRDIKVGDRVAFTFSDRDGRLFIESIGPAPATAP